MPFPQPFPELNLNYSGEDGNPAIQLFGRRFFSDQSVMEFLVELLLLCHSPKWIGDVGPFGGLLPQLDSIQDWPAGMHLKYMPPVRLSLKLFSFLGASKLETRHHSHMAQYKEMLRRLSQVIHAESNLNKEDILRSLENLFLGYQGVGLNRTWCAQTFFPISKELLIQETLWNDTTAKKAGSYLSWNNVISGFKTYFSVSRHRFLGRGGELLYLHLCNALRSRGEELDNFTSSLHLSSDESDPRLLHRSLEQNLQRITGHAPPALDELALLIDGIDEFTAERTNRSGDPIECGWCPEESWREGYMFAVELNRLCMAAIDPIERIELLMIGCALHVLRSLCAQSVRYSKMADGHLVSGGALGYSWIVSDPAGNERELKHLSQRNLQVVQRLIQQALRNEDIRKNLALHPKGEALYKEADDRYGHKFFLSLAKKLGLVIPQRGPGARFVFNDKIVRYLVLALLPPGERRTYDNFKRSLYAHFGIALEGIELEKATDWSELPQLQAASADAGTWLADMLKASGFLIHLSDACSLVHNPFASKTAGRAATSDESERKL